MNVNKKLEKLVRPKNEWTPPDIALFMPKNLLNIENKKAEELRLKAIKYSFKHHYNNNFFYHHLCREKNVKPSDIKNLSDVVKIPLIPDSFFKDYPNDGKKFLKWLSNISSVKIPLLSFKNSNPSYDEIIKALDEKGIDIMFTSGTSGRFSFVPRDKISKNRLKYSWLKCLTETLTYYPDSYTILLIPNPFKTHLTLARAFGLAFELFEESKVYIAMKEKVITTEFLSMLREAKIGSNRKVKSKIINALGSLSQKRCDLKVIHVLEKLAEKNCKVNIGGPPFWLDRIMSLLEKKKKCMSLADGSQVFTGGGWKIYVDRKTPEKVFMEKLERILGVTKERYRDCYAMTECTAAFMDCEGHYKHIPNSFLHPLVLDEDLQPLGYNEYGRFAFIDPLANSYPGFIITGDRVKLLEQCPVCDRPGPVLYPEITRCHGSETRGCALIMEEMINGVTGSKKI
jgi:hypothetical protein